MFSTELRGHGDTLAGLWGAAADQRLAHALLFKGPAGVGKFLAMGRFAIGLLCDSGPGEPCGACGPCKRALSGNHPDLFVVDAAAEGQEQITIHFVAHRDVRPPTAYQGQAIEGFLLLCAHEGGWRIVLVREAERMNEAAQNALLKTLEEPTSSTLLCLETSAPGELLSTVRSRVVQVELGPLAPADVRAVLEREGFEGEELERFARWSRGAPGRAIALREQGATEVRAGILSVLSGERPASDVARALWEIDGEFAGKTAAAKSRSRARAFLDLGLELLADLGRAAAGVAPEELAHGDVAAMIGPLPETRYGHAMEEWLLARQDVLLNLSPEALVDRALGALAPRTTVGVTTADARGEEDMSLKDPVRKVWKDDGRYSIEAYQFLFDALDKAVHLTGRSGAKDDAGRHVSGQELVEGMRQHASNLFGPMAAQVWRSWGIRSTLDWGRIVFLLVDAELLNRRKEDTIDDFRDGFDFDEVFVKKYSVQLPAELGARPMPDEE